MILPRFEFTGTVKLHKEWSGPVPIQVEVLVSEEDMFVSCSEPETEPETVEA